MKNTDLKRTFNEIANEYGFERAYSGWIKEYSDVIQVIDLQKSNHGDYYYLNFKIFIQGLFGCNYIKNKNLIKSEVGDIFIREPENYSKLLRLNIAINEIERKEGLNDMFKNFIGPLSEKTSSVESIKLLYMNGGLFILPSVKIELGL